MPSSSKPGSKHTNLGEARKRSIELFGSAPSFRSSRSKKRSRLSRGSSSDGGGEQKNNQQRGGLSYPKDDNAEKNHKSVKESLYGRCPNVSLRYEKLDRIGEGTYGVVYRARDKQTHDIVALKRCLPHHEASDGFPLTTLREINMLRELNAADDENKRGIVQLKDIAVSSSRSGVFLVFEYCEHDLANLIDAHYSAHKCSPFVESQVKRLSIQLLSALSFLHSRYVLHRDVKLSNLLYNHKGELRLADFGLCRRMGGRIKRDNHPKCCDSSRGDSDDDSDEGIARRACIRHARPASPTTILTPNVVSLWYRPPELLLGAETYDEGVDNWGAACVIAELLKGVPLIKGKNELDQLRLMWDILGVPSSRNWPAINEMPLIKSKSISIPKKQTFAAASSLPSRFRNLSSSGLSLLSNLLQYNPSTRWTAQEALDSHYFREMPMPTNRSLMPTFPTRHGK